MARIYISRTIVMRLSRDDGLTKALKEFILACQHDQPPPRIYKRSGVAANGEEYYPYLALNLYHHHLHRRGDPLLITQRVEGAVYGVALTRHAEYFHGDKKLWLQQHAEIIDWTGLEEWRLNVLAHKPSRI
jgi:hypothetical protein